MTTERAPSPWELESKGWDGQFIYANDERAGGSNRRLIAEVSLMFDGAEANAAFIVRACNAHDDLVKAAAKHLEWIDKERKGPVYPEGMTRDSEGGEAIWRNWWNEQLELCADTEALCRAALEKSAA